MVLVEATLLANSPAAGSEPEREARLKKGALQQEKQKFRACILAESRVELINKFLRNRFQQIFQFCYKDYLGTDSVPKHAAQGGAEPKG